MSCQMLQYNVIMHIKLLIEELIIPISCLFNNIDVHAKNYDYE